MTIVRNEWKPYKLSYCMPSQYSITLCLQMRRDANDNLSRSLSFRAVAVQIHVFESDARCN